MDLGLPQYITIDAGVYKFGGKISINTRTGDVFYSQTPTLSVINKQTEVTHKNSEDLNQKIDVLGMH